MRSAEGFVVLKGFLLIFSDLIFDSKVDPGKPSLAAAPDGPIPAGERLPVTEFRDSCW